MERKFFAEESKFLRILSIVASYVTSKCQALTGGKSVRENEVFKTMKLHVTSSAVSTFDLEAVDEEPLCGKATATSIILLLLLLLLLYIVLTISILIGQDPPAYFDCGEA